jgi:hypothetical protein
MADPCVECNEPTNFGSGRFVNRMVADGGYLCPDCMWPEKCFFCESEVPEDGEIWCRNCGSKA